MKTPEEGQTRDAPGGGADACIAEWVLFDLQDCV
jgi:hypothetical protein